MFEIFNFIAFSSTLILILFAEIGDKTQILTITLATKNLSTYQVIIGATIAESTVSLIGIAIGTTISTIFPVELVSRFAGFFFIIFGVISIVKEDSEEIDDRKNLSINTKGILTVFLTVAAAELGDKTQLAVIALAAEYKSVISIIIGTVLAFMILSILAVLIGKGISKIIPLRIIQKIAAISFIIIGLVLIFGLI